jgi:hypothetical protein
VTDLPPSNSALLHRGIVCFFLFNVRALVFGDDGHILYERRSSESLCSVPFC